LSIPPSPVLVPSPARSTFFSPLSSPPTGPPLSPYPKHRLLLVAATTHDSGTFSLSPLLHLRNHINLFNLPHPRFIHRCRYTKNFAMSGLLRTRRSFFPTPSPSPSTETRAPFSDVPVLPPPRQDSPLGPPAVLQFVWFFNFGILSLQKFDITAFPILVLFHVFSM